MPGIVVGVDGSEHSQQVLEWAMKEAALKQAQLTVLAVHQVAGSYWTRSPIIFPADLPDQEKSRQAAEEAVSQTAARLGIASALVTVQAVSGLPAQLLIDASKDADLVVIGRRGGGGFAGLMMGSVSSQVSHHAACPVVVIPS
jgi:nucleotide-binding universal stress UspA family protein